MEDSSIFRNLKVAQTSDCLFVSSTHREAATYQVQASFVVSNDVDGYRWMGPLAYPCISIATGQRFTDRQVATASIVRGVRAFFAAAPIISALRSRLTAVGAGEALAYAAK